MRKEINNIIRTYNTILENKSIIEAVTKYIPPSNVVKKSNINLNLDTKLQNILNKVFREYGGKVTITSGFRDKERNIKAGGAEKSKHLDNQAIDLVLSDSSTDNILNFIKIASKNGITGIGVYSNGLLHLDIGKRRYWGQDKTQSSTPIWALETLRNHMQDKFRDYYPSKKIDEPKKSDDFKDYAKDYDRVGNKTIGDLVVKALGLPDKNKVDESKIVKEDYIIPGKENIYRMGVVILPKSYNREIYSAISGKINNVRYNRKCKNQVTIEHRLGGKKYFLEYCGISNPKVSNGYVIKKGDLIGTTNNDVVVILYDSSFNQIPIKKIDYFSKKGSGIDKEYSLKTPKKNAQYADPLLAGILLAPFKPFRNVYDNEGKLVKKRWGSPTDKDPVSPIGKSPTEESRIDIKLQENINNVIRLFTNNNK